MKDQEVIQLFREKRDERAFQKLYRYQVVVRKYIKANSGTPSDADDVFQEALIILYRKLIQPEFVLTSTIETLLFGICKRLWLDELGKRKIRIVEREFVSLETEEIFEREESFRKAENALMAITETCREILQLFYHAGWSMVEIASKFGLSSENAAKTQKYKCLEKAKSEYSQLQSLQNTRKL